jgi:diacylglycerol kinase family enzyme
VTASLVIINPNASRVRTERTRSSLAAQLSDILGRRDGTPPRMVETTSAAEVQPVVREAIGEGARTVVGVGGDGTLRDIAAALAGSHVPLGVIPAGTANQVAAVLGIPLALEAAAAAIGTAQPRTIDLIEVDVRIEGEAPTSATAVIGCGAGFDARLMATTPHDLKRRIGRLAYVAQAIKLAIHIDAVPYRFTIDGEEMATDASVALVGNMGQLIPGMLDLRLPIVPDDGLLDLIVVGARGPVDGLRGLADQLLRTSLGGEPGGVSLRLRGREIELVAERPEPLEIDGDYVGDGSLTARVQPAALGVLVPPTS